MILSSRRSPGLARLGRLALAAMGASPVALHASRAWAEAQAPLIKRLDDATRAKVLAALAGLVILGFAVVLLTWLAARVTQRYRTSTPYFRPTPRPGEHDWAKRPLNPRDEMDRP